MCSGWFKFESEISGPFTLYTFEEPGFSVEVFNLSLLV